MPTRFSVVLDDDRAREIETLARQHDLTEEAVIRQLLGMGLEALETEQSVDDGQSTGRDDPRV